jgi:alanine-glyoxylate transaminase / serine-glyoxylate transaminase / serine-pyruvate transaminase
VPNQSGRHFLQVPGPTNIPDRVLRAISAPVIDHRGPELQNLALELLERIKPVFKTKGPVVIFPSSGTGGWEAALVNTLSPGDKVLMFNSGMFAALWYDMITRFGLEAEYVDTDWRRGPDPEIVEAKLAEDKEHKIKAVLVVHNETSNGVLARVAEIRKAIDRAKHPALFMVDTISSLGSSDFRQDEWGVDVAVGGSQKGLMLPAGLSFNAISEKALKAAKTAKLPKCYWDWDWMFQNNKDGFFPYTPATNLFYGLREALSILEEEGLENVFARHERLAEATRRAVRAWGLEIVCAEPREYSSSVTAVFMPQGHSADAFRKNVLENFNMALGSGLGRLADKVFRIGHLASVNELMLAGTLGGVEMGLKQAGVPYKSGGVLAALDYLAEATGTPAAKAAKSQAA